MSKKTKGFLGLLAVLVLIAGFIIPVYTNITQEREEEKRMEKLYQHGFRLLEEQIATYIVEHYSGISKVEFSPIFMSGGGSQSFLMLDVVPVIYDESGNRALLGRRVNGKGYGSYGTFNGLSVDMRDDNSEIIELEDFDAGKIVDVSEFDTLPEEAKLSSSRRIDGNITALVQDKQLVNVQKNDTGSPQAKIIYNLEIERGEYLKWR